MPLAASGTGATEATRCAVADCGCAQALSSKPVAVAPNGPGGGLLAVASRLPPPDWLVDHDLDTASPMLLRKGAPQPSDVESTPDWRRLRGPADLATLDLALEGWETTRALLGG